MTDARVFWANVFTVLKYQGRTVDYLAMRLKVSHTALYRWRDGSRVAPAAQRQLAADVLGVPERLLFLPIVLPMSNESLRVDSAEDDEVAV